MARKVVGVPIGASYETPMPTEFGPNGCTLGLGFLSDQTGVTCKVEGATSSTVYFDAVLTAGCSVDITDTADTLVNVTLTGTNVAGQLSMTTTAATGQQNPWSGGVVPSSTVSDESAAKTAGTSAAYSRGDHAHGPAATSVLASATDVAITTANTLQTIATYSPTATENVLVAVTVEVPTGGATITAQVTFTGDDGADTLTWVSGQAQVAGKWAGAAMLVPAHAGAIDVQVESSVATTTKASASIVAAS